MPTTRAKAKADSTNSNDNQFWHFYLRQHSHPLTRAVHYLGTVGAILVAAGLVSSPLTGVFSTGKGNGKGGGSSRGSSGGNGATAVLVERILGTLLVGYGPSWLSHFLVERNRPATWEAPVRSLRSDLKMLCFFCTGRLGAELRAAGVKK